MLTSILRTAATFGLIGGAAAAGCDGPSLIDRLSPDQLARLQAAAEATPYGEGILWSATKGEARIVLAGTVHLWDDRHLVTLDLLRPAIEGADLVLLEATPAERLAMSEAFVTEPSRVFVTDGPTLPELLGPQDWARVSQALTERGMPPFMAARFQPWFLLVSLSLPPCAMEDLTAGREGLDMLVTDEAEALGTPMAALEPWDTVFRLFEDEDQAEMVEALRTAFDQPELAEEGIVATVEAYFDGEIAEFWELSRISTEFLPKAAALQGVADFEMMEEEILEGRNRAWIPVIEAAAEANPRILLAAGAAHLPGELGLLNLLAERGWTIERLDGANCCEAVWDAP